MSRYRLNHPITSDRLIVGLLLIILGATVGLCIGFRYATVHLVKLSPVEQNTWLEQ